MKVFKDNWFSDLLFDLGFFTETILKVRQENRSKDYAQVLKLLEIIKNNKNLPTTGIVINLKK